MALEVDWTTLQWVARGFGPWRKKRGKEEGGMICLNSRKKSTLTQFHLKFIYNSNILVIFCSYDNSLVISKPSF